jgi:outer membrane receptor protein involved in Fe transport
MINAAGSYFRGDEGNLAEKLDDYTLLNARMEYRFGEHASVFLSVDNLLDEEYATFSLFGEADEVLGGDFDDPSFLSPGAPRAAWAGVRVQF